VLRALRALEYRGYDSWGVGVGTGGRVAVEKRAGRIGESVADLPPGFTISESVNGVVSLVRDRPSPIQPAEVAAAEAAIHQHPQAHRYRVAAKRDRIEFSERVGPDYADVLHEIGVIGLARSDLAEGLRDLEERHARFAPVLRLTLVDRERRVFRAERWCYLGSIDDWITLGQTGTAAELARALVPALGTDDFYELW
jgi:hypothetical protein